MTVHNSPHLVCIFLKNLGQPFKSTCWNAINHVWQCILLKLKQLNSCLLFSFGFCVYIFSSSGPTAFPNMLLIFLNCQQATKISIYYLKIISPVVTTYIKLYKKYCRKIHINPQNDNYKHHTKSKSKQRKKHQTLQNSICLTWEYLWLSSHS